MDPSQIPVKAEVNTIYGRKYKIAVVGLKGTGKTRLINTYKRQAVTEDYGSTDLKRVSELVVSVNSDTEGKV
jgi:GTPase SAR1 family protein